MPPNEAAPPGAELEVRLEQLLRADAVGAPLPADLLRVPRGWIRGRRRRTIPIVRALAVGGAIATAVILGVALPRAWQAGADLLAGPLTHAQAAALANAPEAQVLPTRDGFIALRVIDDPKTVVQVLLIEDTDPEPTVSVLTQARIPITNVQPDSNLVWVEALSCTPDRGLEQPHMLFGWTQPAPSAVSLNVEASWTQSGGFFIAVLEDGMLNPAQEIAITLGGAEDRRSASLFAQSDRCTGDPPARGH